MKFTLGRFVFRTKGDAVKAVRNVLNSALPGLFLSGDELDLVTAVLDRHHDRENKLAGGMIGIMVQWNNEAGYLSRCFHIVRPDWSTVDFSYRVALDQAPKGPTIEQACRMAVLPDIRAYRDARLAAGPQCCDASGEPLTPPTPGNGRSAGLSRNLLNGRRGRGCRCGSPRVGFLPLNLPTRRRRRPSAPFTTLAPCCGSSLRKSIRAWSGKRLPRPPRKCWPSKRSHSERAKPWDRRAAR
jgi:hypothetical protein